MRDSELIEKVQSSINRQCYTRGYVAPVDVLMDVGVLDKRKYEDWRTGKFPYLESVCTCNLRQLSLIMKQIRKSAQESGYHPSYCFYGRWGMKKKKDRSRRNVQPLRFSKSGNPKIERAYATHYVDGRRIAELKAEADQKRAELMPVVTLVIYFDSKKWDGPRTIHEMFSVQDEELLSYVPDYKINLIEPAMMKKEDFDKFSTTLKEVLTFIKYSKDADGLKEALDADPNFHHLGREEVDVLNACVNADLHLSESEATIDVCEAIRVLNQRAADEAAEKATENAEKKRITTLVESINNLKKNMGWTSEKAMEILGLSESDRKAAAPFL